MLFFLRKRIIWFTCFVKKLSKTFFHQHYFCHQDHSFYHFLTVLIVYIANIPIISLFTCWQLLRKEAQKYILSSGLLMLLASTGP